MYYELYFPLIQPNSHVIKSRTTEIFLDGILRGKITIILEIKKIQDPYND